MENELIELLKEVLALHGVYSVTKKLIFFN